MHRFKREIAKHVFQFPSPDVVALELGESFFDVPRTEAALIIRKFDQSDGCVRISFEWGVSQREDNFARRRGRPSLDWLSPEKISYFTYVFAQCHLSRVYCTDFFS